jgi:SET domain-containing protein
MAIKVPIKIIVKNIGKKGRGVFAVRNIKKGEIVEVCPVIVVPKSQEKLLRKTLLDDYCFPWATQYQPAIVLGYGSLYNHSYTPNVEYDEKVKQKVMVFTALRNIKKGEEITSNYNGDHDNKDEVWFKVR